jgi:ferrous iron transport protein A
MDRQSSQAQKTSLSVTSTRPLSELRSEESAAIESLRGGAGFRSRLAALGFTPGTRIKMLQNQGHGPIIVTVRDTRIALGRGEAYKIWVKSE